MKSILLFIIVCVWSTSGLVQEKTITFSYWSEASPPFVFSSDKKLKDIQAGIIKDLGLLIAKRLQVSPKFVNLPVQRIEAHLQTGAIDIDCITNPVWKESPDAYNWSPALFEGSDRFLVRSGHEHKLTKFEDLKGKSLGIYNGYIYSQTLMDMIKSGDINTVKVTDIDHGVQLLLLDRVDALIDFDILLNYKIKQAAEGSLVLADLISEKYSLFCAYSKKMPYEKSLIDSEIQTLISSGEIKELLNKY